MTFTLTCSISRSQVDEAIAAQTTRREIHA